MNVEAVCGRMSYEVHRTFAEPYTVSTIFPSFPPAWKRS